MGQDNCSERRRLPRFLLPGGVRPEDSNTIPLDVLDISVGGVRFESDKKLPPGTEIEFWFDYYYFEFKLSCQVTWTRLADNGAWEHGAVFGDLSRAERIVIADYVRDLHAITDKQAG